jgi:hypothetical protein
MTLRDKRSYRVALVADRYLNPSKGKLDAVPILLEADWGAIQLPSDDYPSAVAGPLLEQVAEQVEEFHRRGYDAVVIGRREGLDEALKAAGVPHLDQIEPATARALKAFLGKRPAPAAKAPSRRPALSRR